jgi:hypothetical protein
MPKGIRPSPRNTRSNDVSRSTSVTAMPQRTSSNAVAAPAGPAPTTKTFIGYLPTGSILSEIYIRLLKRA